MRTTDNTPTPTPTPTEALSTPETGAPAPKLPGSPETALRYLRETGSVPPGFTYDPKSTPKMRKTKD